MVKCTVCHNEKKTNRAGNHTKMYPTLTQEIFQNNYMKFPSVIVLKNRYSISPTHAIG